MLDTTEEAARTKLRFAVAMFGVCRLAFADVAADDSNATVDEELICTTLNGDLVVFDLKGAGTSVRVNSLLYHQVFDGALGATNSIAVDTTASPPAIYIAGSMGTRKFTVSTQP